MEAETWRTTLAAHYFGIRSQLPLVSVAVILFPVLTAFFLSMSAITSALTSFVDDSRAPPLVVTDHGVTGRSCFAH